MRLLVHPAIHRVATEESRARTRGLATAKRERGVDLRTEDRGREARDLGRELREYGEQALPQKALEALQKLVLLHRRRLLLEDLLDDPRLSHEGEARAGEAHLDHVARQADDALDQPRAVAGRAEGDHVAALRVVQVREHPIFTREDTEVLCEMPISFVQAALGGQVDVPTLDGPAKLKIPAGTQSGKVFRLKGKGVQSLSGTGRGDQHVKVVVEVPTNMSSKQKKLLEEFAAMDHEAVHPQSKSFFAKVKELFGSKS